MPVTQIPFKFLIGHKNNFNSYEKRCGQYFSTILIIPLRVFCFYALHEGLNFLLISLFFREFCWGKILLASWKQQSMFEKAGFNYKYWFFLLSCQWFVKSDVIWPAKRVGASFQRWKSLVHTVLNNRTRTFRFKRNSTAFGYHELKAVQVWSITTVTSAVNS